MASPVSNTKMLALIKALDWKAVKLALEEHPELLRYRAKKGENFLHLCCAIDIAKHRLRSGDSLKTAGALLDAGLDLDGEAFREGAWKATPLWYAVGRGKNPGHCMWAAAFNDDPAMIRLLWKAGATEPVCGCQNAARMRSKSEFPRFERKNRGALYAEKAQRSSVRADVSRARRTA